MNGDIGEVYDHKNLHEQSYLHYNNPLKLHCHGTFFLKEILRLPEISGASSLPQLQNLQVSNSLFFFLEYFKMRMHTFYAYNDLNKPEI